MTDGTSGTLFANLDPLAGLSPDGEAGELDREKTQSYRSLSPAK